MNFEHPWSYERTAEGNALIESVTFSSCNVLRIEVWTNCPRGGDTGNGGKTIFRLVNEANTDMRVAVNGEDCGPEDCEIGNVIEITLGGDCENATFLDCLRFAVKALERQHKYLSECHKDECESGRCSIDPLTETGSKG